MTVLAPTRGIAHRPHRLWLQKPGPRLPDPDGGYTQTWIDLTPPTLDGGLINATPQNMEHFGSSGAVQVSTSFLINVPFHPGIDTTVRITYNGRQLFVSGVQNIEERNEELWLSVEERTA